MNDQRFSNLRPGDTFRFQHQPDEGPYLKIGEREYLSLAVRRIGVRSAPVDHVRDVPALEHVALLATPPPTDFAAILAPAAAAALEREYRPDVDAMADELVEDLLTCGHNPGATKGDHLRIMLDGRELAGWNEAALRSRVRVAIRKVAAPSPAAVLEAIQDEESLLRLALALNAAAASYRNCDPDVPEVLETIATFLENPADARRAIKSREDRDRRGGIVR